MLPLNAYLGLSIVMFLIGAVGFVVRKNAIVVFMCIELMLNAAGIAFVAFGAGLEKDAAALDGQIATLFIMLVAAAEAAVGLAVIIAMFRVNKGVETDAMAEMKR